MLLVLPVPFRRLEGRVYVEAQAANGLDRWADHFERVIVAAPLVPEALVPSLAGVVWREVGELSHGKYIQCEPLPWAYAPATFFRELKATRARLAGWIRSVDHLQFAIGGLVGDWAAVAALEARRLGRRYAIHTDRVEHALVRSTGTTGLHRLRVAIEAPLLERYHRRVIRGCSLGLWHGDDCFQAYAPWCVESHLIHDVHTKAADRIAPAELEANLAALLRVETLELCYAGRLDPMKAPLEWLRAIARARALGARVHATWYGEGAMLEQARAETARLGLADCVRYAGFVSDRVELLAAVRAAHALVFTHVTPESPRNLLEALVSGTPIVGYANPYAVDLIRTEGGGALVPVHAADALGSLIAELCADRTRLARLTREAAENGRRFTDEAVFAERSDLVKRFA